MKEGNAIDDKKLVDHFISGQRGMNNLILACRSSIIEIVDFPVIMPHY